MLAAPVTAQEWRIVVTDARGAYSISDLKLWGELAQDPGKPSEVFIDCAAPTAGDGSAARPLNSLQQLRKLELAVGATINFRTGTDCADADATVWVYGSDTNPVRVRSWGAGSPATIGGVTLGERFADYAAQGWELEAGPERNRSPRGGLVHQHLEADED